ncbi:hypothetical protein DNTS_008705 [Danionella cerebrum]|uniref:Uncharacterized protein n=1 Tax=Danionella cerebrum TaxID=2873325 RepID=A0A553MTF6_9TELE|nr:hypothetical protein DNTS_008705 [Danionella translucida]
MEITGIKVMEITETMATTIKAMVDTAAMITRVTTTTTDMMSRAATESPRGEEAIKSTTSHISVEAAAETFSGDFLAGQALTSRMSQARSMRTRVREVYALECSHLVWSSNILYMTSKNYNSYCYVYKP